MLAATIMQQRVQRDTQIAMQKQARAQAIRRLYMEQNLPDAPPETFRQMEDFRIQVWRHRFGDKFCGVDEAGRPIIWGQTNIPKAGDHGHQVS